MKTIKKFANKYYCTEGKSIREIMREFLSDGESVETILGDFVDMMEEFDKKVSNE